jgi:hypothetical protein
VAIGTVGAVVYALFRDLFVTRRRPPRLDLRFDHAGNDQVVVGTAEPSTPPRFGSQWRTEREKDTADDMVVIVTEVRQLEDFRQDDGRSKTDFGLPLTCRDLARR